MINWIAFNKSFIFPQLKNTSENECNFSAEERTRKNEHGFSFLEAVKVHIFQKRESVFIFARAFFCRKIAFVFRSIFKLWKCKGFVESNTIDHWVSISYQKRQKLLMINRTPILFEINEF